MNLNQLRYLEKIVEYGSITLAAQQLFISQPSLSKSIAQLENEYGIKILDRKPNGIELTQQGKDFLNCAKNILSASTNLDVMFSDRDSERRSQLYIASQQVDFLYGLLLKTFEQNKEKASFSNIVETDRSNVVRLILVGDVDIGIIVRTSSDAKSFLWQTESKRLEVHTLDSAGVFACVGPKSPYYNCEKITFSDAERCSQVALDVESEAKRDYYFNRTNSHFNSKSLIFFNTISACERFLIETDALLFISKWTIGYFLGTPIRTVSVVSERENEPMPVTELLWMKRAGEPLNSIEAQFIQNLNENFSDSNVE